MRRRGFTLIELLLVVAVIAVLAALAGGSMALQRPRANLASAITELQALVHGARQQALADGRDVSVLFFPRYANGVSTGRVVVYEDGDGTLYRSAATPNFGTYDAGAPAYGAGSQVVTTFDLPSGVTFGLPAGLALNAPWNGIVDVTKECSFCATGGDRRGAVRFDARGRAFFYADNGNPTAGLKGGAVTLNAPQVAGQATLLIISSTGAVRALQGG